MDTALASTIENQVAVRNALISGFRSLGMRLLPDRDQDVMGLLTSKGVTATVNAAGYLELEQAGTPMVISRAFETLRKENPTWFVSDPKRDTISAKEDFHGSAQEIAHGKAQWIATHGLTAWEALPRTRAEAENRSVVPSADLNRAQYLTLPLSDKAALAGLIGSDGIGRIMARTK